MHGCQASTLLCVHASLSERSLIIAVEVIIPEMADVLDDLQLAVVQSPRPFINGVLKLSEPHVSPRVQCR